MAATVNFGRFPCMFLTRKAKARLGRPSTVRCAVEGADGGRRLISVSLVLVNFWLFTPEYAVAGSIFDKYVKRKKLDPLEAYVPAVILTRFQIEDVDARCDVDFKVTSIMPGLHKVSRLLPSIVGKALEIDQPQYASCRSLLRSGPAASLRVNIRAVAQYASDNGNGKTASVDVDQCLRALEELDSLLLRASRNDSGASVKSMKSQITITLDALDSLLQTVPTDVLDKGRAIADAYRKPEEDVEPENLDPDLKQLESIL